MIRVLLRCFQAPAEPMEPEPLEMTIEETDFPVEEIGDALEPRRYHGKKTQKCQQKWGLGFFLVGTKLPRNFGFMQVAWRMIIQWGDLMCGSFVV